MWWWLSLTRPSNRAGLPAGSMRRTSPVVVSAWSASYTACRETWPTRSRTPEAIASTPRWSPSRTVSSNATRTAVTRRPAPRSSSAMVGVWDAVTAPTLLSQTRTIQDYELFKSGAALNRLPWSETVRKPLPPFSAGALTSAPVRDAAFGHRLAGFGEVLGPEAPDLLLQGQPEAFLGAKVPRGVDRPPGAPNRQRRLGSQAGGELGRGGLEVLAGDDPVGQPDPQGLGGVDDVAEQDQLPGAALADDPGQPDRGAHVGQQPVAGLQQAHLGALGEDAEIAGQGQLEAGAVGVAAHGGDAGAAEIGDPAERPGCGLARAEAARVQRLLGQVGQDPAEALDQVDAGREGRPFSGHHQASERLVGQQLGAEPGQLLPHQRVLSVALGGTGQGQGADVALTPVPDGLVAAHLLISPQSRGFHPYSSVWMEARRHQRRCQRRARGEGDSRCPPRPAYLAAPGSSRDCGPWRSAAPTRSGSSRSPRRSASPGAASTGTSPTGARCWRRCSTPGSGALPRR